MTERRQRLASVGEFAYHLATDMLRVVHTSDWHLGQQLKERTRHDEHAHFLAWLIDLLEERAVDVLLVAGDVFDVANPQTAALRTWFEFLAEARRRCPTLQIIAVAGNHDSPALLEAPAPLLASLGAHVVGRVPWPREAGAQPDLARLCIPLHDARGAVAAHCLAVPFLRPGDVPRVEHSELAHAKGIEKLYADITRHALALRAPDQALIAMGHATVLRSREEERGDDTEESALAGVVDEELDNDAIRPIVLGGVERLASSIFSEQLAYVALGHLHRASRVGQRDNVRYSGSPIPLSFSERRYRHQVVYVELEGAETRRVEPVYVPRWSPMLRIPERAAGLDAVLAALRAWVPDEPDRPAWIEVALDHRGGAIVDLVAQIDEALKGKPVRAWKLLERPRSESMGREREQGQHARSLDEVRRMLDPERLLELAWQRTHDDDTELTPALRQSLRELLVEPEPS